jgi:large subunit ribosomal protein L21
MYAVIETGGKQYRVAPGDKIKIEKLTHETGESIVFEKVLLFGDGEKVSIGSPYLEKAAVNATVLQQGRHKKIHIIKQRRRKHTMKHQGHRQYFTEVSIDAIKI